MPPTCSHGITWENTCPACWLVSIEETETQARRMLASAEEERVRRMEFIETRKGSES